MIKVIKAFLQIIFAKNDEVLLMWDANASLENNEINRMFTAMNMSNVMPITPEGFSTYIRVKQIIYHI